MERLRRHQGNYAWRLPDILALDTTETGTDRLIAWAQSPPLCRRRWLHTANVGARPFWRSWMVAD